MTTVVHLTWFAAPHIGGIETHLLTLAADGARLGDRHLVVAGTRQVPTSNHRYAPVLDRNVKLDEPEDALDRLAADLGIRPDIVHCHNLHLHLPERGRHLLRAARRRWRVPIILDVHNLSSSQPLAAPLHVDHVIVHSRYMCEALAAKGITAAKLPYAFPIPTDAPPQPDAEDLVLVQPTRFCWWKGSYHVLHAILALQEHRPHIRFRHYGVELVDLERKWDSRAEERFPALRELVRRDPGSGSITFGRLTANEVARALTRAQAVIHPTVGRGLDGEPFGISAAQAIIAGRPLVLSNSGNLATFAQDYPAAVVVDPGDSSELLRSLTWASAAAPLPPDKNRLGSALAATTRDAAAAHCRFYERSCE